MEKDHISGLRIAKAADDLTGRCAHAVTAATAPGHQRVSVASGGAGEMKGLEPHGRPKERRPLSDDVLDHGIRSANLLIPVALPTHHAQMSVLEAVIPNNVSLGIDSLDQVRQALCVLADNEEGRFHAPTLQALENLRRDSCVGTIVERKGDPRGRVTASAIQHLSADLTSRHEHGTAECASTAGGHPNANDQCSIYGHDLIVLLLV